MSAKLQPPPLPAIRPAPPMRQVRPVAGFDPAQHPEWERQVALETSMVQRGAERFREDERTATEKNRMSALKPHSRLLKTWSAPVAAGVEAFIKRKARGVVPIALSLLRESEIPAEDIAAIALVTIIDRLSLGKLLRLAVLSEQLGGDLDYERRIRWWSKTAPDAYGSTLFHLNRTKATAVHRRRVNIHEYNDWVRRYEGSAPQAWTKDEQRFVGLQLIDLVLRHTKAFIVADDPQARIKTQGKFKSPPKVLLPTDELTQWLSEAMTSEEIIRPMYLPMLMPPKPWTNPKNGGYWTPVVRSPFMVRFKPANEHVRGRAIDEMMAYDMPNVYEALNYIQGTAWKVNSAIYDVAKYLWDKDLGVAGLPLKRHEDLPPKPHDLDTNPESLRTWKRAASEVYGRNAKSYARSIAAKQCLDIATEFKDEPAFYFPHLLDFRGRCYPIPSGLSPQGTDLARGLLTFSAGTEVTPGVAEDWLYINAANTYGKDKTSFQERIKWVEDNSDMILSVASQPLEDRRWCEADKPFQFLAASMELKAWAERDPSKPFYSSLPIHVDGTCNGIQHLAAMVLDKDTGRKVNLVPGVEPQDIYQEVADELQLRLEKLTSGYAAMWLSVCNNSVPRSLTKRCVMILPYGGTRQAYQRYIMEWLEEHDPQHQHVPKDEAWKACQWLVDPMWDAVMIHAGAAQKVMQWIKDCAKKSFTVDMPLTWQTPVGFIVRHFYGEKSIKQVESKLNGRRIRVAFVERAEKVCKPEQLRGISPNFVHSMDASAMLICAIKAKHAGIPHMAAIHDSFGTSAGQIEAMNYLLREAFVENYTNDVLENFALTVEDFSRTKCPKPLEKGELVVEDIINSEYFFA